MFDAETGVAAYPKVIYFPKIFIKKKKKPLFYSHFWWVGHIPRIRFWLTKTKLAEKKNKKKKKVLAVFFIKSPHREESNAVL